jgi:hypothetical protein
MQCYIHVMTILKYLAHSQSTTLYFHHPTRLQTNLLLRSMLHLLDQLVLNFSIQLLSLLLRSICQPHNYWISKQRRQLFQATALRLGIEEIHYNDCDHRQAAED